MKESEHLLQLMQRNHGALTKEIVVQDAADPQSPIHHLFEWDDTKASHAYRLVQAGHLIRRVRVQIINPAQQEEPLKVRAFVSTPSQHGKPIYRHIADLDEQQRQYITQQMKADIAALVSKYRAIEGFWEEMDVHRWGAAAAS